MSHPPALPSIERSVLRVWDERLDLVAQVLGTDAGAAASSADALALRIGSAVDMNDRAQMWLTLSVLSGELPDDETVIRTCREAELSGPGRVLATLSTLSTPASLASPVAVVQHEVLIDVEHTVNTRVATGIQRVVRETVRRWAAQHRCRIIGWTAGFTAIRTLTAVEDARMRGLDDVPPEVAPTRLVPWQCTYLVPELAAGSERVPPILAMAHTSPNRTGVIGFDLVPITSAETAGEGMSAAFAVYLAAVRHVDRVAAISDAAATEYQGWRTMLGAIGVEGPDIRAISLPTEAPQPSADDLAAARERFCVGDLPLVLCVGSHEPRKNHLAVLAAAERLWREGHRFTLTFVGGHSWKAGRFQRELARLQAAGHPVESANAVSDSMLWAAYRLARFSVFPSLNEGFGLPAAESLAAGTPVVTSNFGSMAEIAAGGGALMIDPRDDESVAGAMRQLLDDDRLLSDLAAAARGRATRTWDEYAEEAWTYLTEPA